jgi:hypothetical protein
MCVTLMHFCQEVKRAEDVTATASPYVVVSVPLSSRHASPAPQERENAALQNAKADEFACQRGGIHRCGSRADAGGDPP